MIYIVMTRPTSRKLSYNSFILCPDGHKNVRGLEECATCNLPLINFKKEGSPSALVFVRLNTGFPEEDDETARPVRVPTEVIAG